MNDKSNNKGAGQQKGKPAVSQKTRNTARTTTSSTSSSSKAPAASAAARSSGNNKTRTSTTTQSGSSGSGGGSGHVVREEKSSGGWLAPVALLFGLVGTLLSGFLWSKLNSFSSTTNTALVSQKEETATMVADTKTELNAALDEKTGALQTALDEKTGSLQTALETQAAQNTESLANLGEQVNEQMASFGDEMRSEAEAGKQEVATSTAQSLQDFTTKSEGELNTISTSFNVGIRTLREDMEGRFQENESQAVMMQETLQSTNELANRGQRDWILAEVEYLLRTGHHRVKLAGDVKAGVLALESANDRLHALGDIDYFPVREQIEREVTELRRLGPPNIEGLIFRLETASKVADTLPLKATESEQGEGDASGDSDASGTSESKGSAVGNLLKSINFSVSSTDQTSIDSKLSQQASSSAGKSPSKQQMGASEALSTHLQAARLSALRADSERFTYHMDNSIKYTDEVFDGEQDSVKEFIANLDEIRQTNIVPNVPILGSALSMFEKIDAKRSEK